MRNTGPEDFIVTVTCKGLYFDIPHVSGVLNIHLLIIASALIGIFMVCASALGIYSTLKQSENFLGIYLVSLFFLVLIQGKEHTKNNECMINWFYVTLYF